MTVYDFDKEVNRKGTGCAKWDSSFKSDAEELFPLWVADMDFPCSEAIIEALHERVDERIYGYSTGLDKAYRKAVCRWFKKRFQWKIDPATIYYANGVVPAIAWLIEILSKPKEGIVIQTPVYYPFRKKIEACDRKVMENPLINMDGVYTMDYIHLESLMKKEDCSGMILCSPHNPVGRVWRRDELLQVVKIAKRYHKWIIADEIHCDIIRSNRVHIPLASIAKEYEEQIITCTAPSKTFNLAGLQNSNIIIANEAYQKKWEAYVWQRLSQSAPNSFAYTATIAAYTKSQDWLDQVNAYIDANVKATSEYLAKQLPQAVLSESEGTYLLWIDLRAYVQDKKRLEKCMRQHGLIFDEGYLFGKEGECFERINVACPRSLLIRCLEVFTKAVKTL